ncbi:hypothetical protein NKT34_17520 [Paenibacillus polysaccharolyticus]|nr:hypothetical protein [Paenibacillus polysaccharolyticus]MCP1135101.1 hypothetical protein [Paenibacillus polysaccharolyticus]
MKYTEHIDWTSQAFAGSLNIAVATYMVQLYSAHVHLHLHMPIVRGA